MEPEIDFPRGGAGVLTAVEIRDVKDLAKQDVLFKDVCIYLNVNTYIKLFLRKQKR